MSLKECDIPYNDNDLMRKLYESCPVLDNSVKRFPLLEISSHRVWISKDIPIKQVFNFIQQLFEFGSHHEHIHIFIASVMYARYEHVYDLMKLTEYYGELSFVGQYFAYPMKLQKIRNLHHTMYSQKGYKLNRSEYIIILSRDKNDYSLLDNYSDEIVVGNNSHVMKAWSDYQQYCINNMKTA